MNGTKNDGDQTTPHDPYAGETSCGGCLSFPSRPLDPIEQLRQVVTALEARIEYDADDADDTATFEEPTPFTWMDQLALKAIGVTRLSLLAKPGLSAIEVFRQIELMEHLLTWPGENYTATLNGSHHHNLETGQSS